MLNVVAMTGRLVHDPELKTTKQGTSVCSFRIACDRNYARPGEQRQADFFDVQAWRGTAEFICKYFRKGQMIALEGSLQTSQYQDKNGDNRTRVEVLAKDVSFCGSSKSGESSEMLPTAEPTPFDAPPPRPVQTSLEGGQMYPGERLSDYAPPGQRTAQAAQDNELERRIAATEEDDLPF